MSTSAFTLLLLASALSQVESACICPSSHPACEHDGNCWKRSGGRYSWQGLSCGKCASSYADSSHVLKDSKLGSRGKCYSYYGSSNEWCYTQKSDGTFASSKCESYDGFGKEWCCPDRYACREASPAPVPSTGKLRNSKLGTLGRCYSYYGSAKGKEWCYTKKRDGSFATSKCESYDGYKTSWCCPEKYNCRASESSSGGCHASELGQFVADFVKGKKGRKVYSDKQGTAQCWDLAWAAMEQAAKHGLSPVFYQKESGWANAYVWSSEVVPVDQAQPGDIAQFKGWREPYRSAWNPHTAVVTGCYKDGVLPTYQQNPSPVHEAKYHPEEKTSGQITIYRLKSSSSRLRLYSQMPHFEVFRLHSAQLSVLVGVCAITGLIAAAAVTVKWQRSVARSAPPTECRTLLSTETSNPDFVGVPIQYSSSLGGRESALI